MEKDAWESGGAYGAFLLGQDANHLEVRLRFRFVDKEGNVTRREVTTKTFAADPDNGAIRGHCHLRKANRVFVMSRMSDVVDVETGEVIKSLPRWFLDRYATTPEARARAFVDRHASALGLLAAMARADGSMRAAERVLMAKWCVLHGAAPATAVAATQDTRRWVKPSAIAIGRDLRAVATEPAPYRASVLKAMQEMIGTDKQERDEETRLFAKANKALTLKG